MGSNILTVNTKKPYDTKVTKQVINLDNINYIYNDGANYTFKRFHGRQLILAISMPEKWLVDINQDVQKQYFMLDGEINKVVAVLKSQGWQIGFDDNMWVKPGQSDDSLFFEY
jgi:hypothetical protein